MTPLERADELLSLASADAEGLVSHRIIQARQLVQAEQTDPVACDGSGRPDARYADGGRDTLDRKASADISRDLDGYLDDVSGDNGPYATRAEAVRDLLALGRLVRKCDARDLLEDYADQEGHDAE